MKNYIQLGHNLTVTGPTGGVASGNGMLIGAMFGVACGDIAEGERGEMSVVGVYRLPKAAGATSAFVKIFWDNSAKVVTTTASGNTAIGAATSAAASGDGTVTVRLNGIAA